MQLEEKRSTVITLQIVDRLPDQGVRRGRRALMVLQSLRKLLA
jgi:hypothetical protein